MERRIIDYATVVTDDAEDLDKEVKESIQDGWQPFGGVCVSLCESEEFRYQKWAQAMVKYGIEPVSDDDKT